MTKKAEEKHRCPPHHWIIDEKNVGRCKYCGAVKDFGKELRRWFGEHKGAPVRGAVESKKERIKRKRGRPPKYG